MKKGNSIKKSIESSFDSRTLYRKTRSGSGFSSLEAKTVAKRVAMVNEFEQSNNVKPMHYKEAFLYSANEDPSKNWYVEYSYLYPGQTTDYKRIKLKFNINRRKTAIERLNYGNELVKFLNKKLKSGYNPFTAIKIEKAEIKLKIPSQLFIIKAALVENAPSDYAISSYTENYNRLINYITDRGIEGILLCEFNMEEAKRFKTYLIDQKKAQKTINSTFSYLSKFWEIAIDKKYTDQNPFKSIPRVKKREAKKSNKVERFEPITSEEMDTIFTKLRGQQQENFIRFLAVIYYAWARPVEITRLKVQDIEMKRELIRFKKNETKNNDSAYVQIVPPLLKLLQQMDLKKYPGEYYLFSDDFKPGTRQVSKHYALTRWSSLVKAKEGSINVTKDMYALKHTGNIEYLLKNKGNVDLKWQQMQNRHQSSTMTDRYNRKLGVYFIEVGELNYRHFE